MHTKKTNNTNKLMQISYHSALTKIQKLQNFKKKKKKFPVPADTSSTGWYCPKFADTAGIFSSAKQGGYMYRIACQYDIFRQYQSVRYGIDSLDFYALWFKFLVFSFFFFYWVFYSLINRTKCMEKENQFYVFYSYI